MDASFGRIILIFSSKPFLLKSELIISCTVLIAPTVCAVGGGGRLKAYCSPKNGDRSFALSPVCWTVLSLRDHLVMSLCKQSRVPMSVHQDNLLAGIKTSESVSQKNAISF